MRSGVTDGGLLSVHFNSSREERSDETIADTGKNESSVLKMKSTLTSFVPPCVRPASGLRSLPV